MRLTVISDIHGNGRALQAAIAEVGKFAPDQVVILGDLLTYGPDVNCILDDLESLAEGYSTDWILGNHEELYLNLVAGDTAYVDGLPQWIRDSIYWTFERLDTKRLARLPWQKQCIRESILCSHANPWGSWQYLQTDEDCQLAQQTLMEGGFRAGVFGHTHRYRFHVGKSISPSIMEIELDENDIAVVNAGSVGQPRNETATSTILNIETGNRRCRFQLISLQYDTKTHLTAIEQLALPQATRDRLVSFFVPKIF